MGRGRPFSIIQWVITENAWRGIIKSPTISAQQNGSFLSSFCWLKVQIAINSPHSTWSRACLSASHLRFLHNHKHKAPSIKMERVPIHRGKWLSQRFYLFVFDGSGFPPPDVTHLLIYKNKPGLLLSHGILLCWVFDLLPSLFITTGFRYAPETKVVWS